MMPICIYSFGSDTFRTLYIDFRVVHTYSGVNEMILYFSLSGVFVCVVALTSVMIIIVSYNIHLNFCIFYLFFAYVCIFLL